MLSKVFVVSRSGFVLYSKDIADSGPQLSLPLNELIKSVLLQARISASNEAFVSSSGRHAVKYRLNNKYGLIYAVVYERAFPVEWADDLLAVIDKNFVDKFFKSSSASSNSGGSATQCSSATLAMILANEAFEFDEELGLIIEGVQSEFKNRKVKAPRSFEHTARGKQIAKEREPTSGSSSSSSNKKPKKPKKTTNSSDDSGNQSDDESVDILDNEPDVSSPDASGGSNAGEYSGSSEPSLSSDDVSTSSDGSGSSAAAAPRRPGPGPRKIKGPSKPKVPTPSATDTKRKGRKGGEEPAVLDYSRKTASSSGPVASGGTAHASVKITLDDDEPKEKSSWTSSFFSRFNLTGKDLSEADLEPVISEFRDHLISKNVAAEIADKLCESVGTSLKGQRIAAFSSVHTAVREALKSALSRILTPPKTVDILRDVQTARKEGRPYSIVFVGVNGVGKSTSLAKVCSWLKQNDLSVMIIACDTFRAGAVEQLKVHADALNVPLYQQGYASDPTNVAKFGIKDAKTRGIDVVLIDTAGRLQNNETLMTALSTLVNTNRPDLVLFVGEALVGNDGVHQLVEFNRAMREFSRAPEPRLIDGIVLTKFDTIDDKVGAALSMVYSTGQPIMFVGTGQHYTNLKKLNVDAVVEALAS